MAPAPLPVLLSQVLVAFTIEFDNAFEHRLHKTWAQPFLTSMAMWSHVMRHVRDEGITMHELQTRSRLPQAPLRSLIGAHERWNYLQVGRDPRTASADFGSARGVKPDTRVVPTMTGALAQTIWTPLSVEIEERWAERFGGPVVEELRHELSRVHAMSRTLMPAFLPVLTAKGLFSAPVVELAEGDAGDEQELATLLSRVLLAFTLDYEGGSQISLPIASTVLRVLTSERRDVAGLPLASGVSREAVGMCLTWLQAADLVVVEPGPNGKGRVARLTARGVSAQVAHEERLTHFEEVWVDRFGSDRVTSLVRSLEAVLAHPSLSEGLATPEGGWRASARYRASTAAVVEAPRDALPACPMVLHRGGWPDGS